MFWYNDRFDRLSIFMGFQYICFSIDRYHPTKSSRSTLVSLADACWDLVRFKVFGKEKGNGNN